MSNFLQADSEYQQDVQFLQGEAWEMHAAPLLKGNIRFDYTYVWNDPSAGQGSMAKPYDYINEKGACLYFTE